MKFALKYVVVFVFIISAFMSTQLTAANAASTRYQRAAAWQKQSMMLYKIRIARANGSPSPTWPHSHCAGRCHHLINLYAKQRTNAKHAWLRIQNGTSQTAVRKLIRYWFSRGGRSVLANAMIVFGCENSFVASNGPSPTDDWGFAQINRPAHLYAFGGRTYDQATRIFMKTVLVPWRAVQVAWRWSQHGTNFSPTWTCASIHGIA